MLRLIREKIILSRWENTFDREKFEAYYRDPVVGDVQEPERVSR